MGTDGHAGGRLATGPAAATSAADDLLLLQRYEPVLRFTHGELFLPMLVEDYLGTCSLWRSARSGGRRGRGRAERLCGPGELTPARLAEFIEPPAQQLWLQYVQRGLRRGQFRAWRRDVSRPRLAAGSSRFAAVGLLGRLIDAVLRLSLLLRGRVPGGTAAAAEQMYRTKADPGRCPYYGRVTRDRGFTVLQYWYFYAMNDWRSTFAGVNDHEADWEQVTLFLPDPPEASARPAWVAFSSHDEAGDDLRRRADDPDLQWQGSHPVVYVGAGSHSGAFLPGDYLVTVEPPALGRLFAGLRRLTRLLLPWTRGHSGSAIGIPFIDYRRGDGVSVGPGEARTWLPVILGDQTPWLCGYRGLWGLDSGDPFGGERAPAGPRYERDGSVRLCWSDPVGWAGLDKEIPSPAAGQQAIQDRMAELAAQLTAAQSELDARGDRLRGARAGLRALRATGREGDDARLAGLEAAVRQVRARRQALAEEREALARALLAGLPQDPPHAHLRHRALPNADSARARPRVLRAWSAVSASVLLAGLGVVILGHFGALLPAAASLAAVMLCTEAFARGQLARFVLGLLVAVIVAVAVWLVVWAAVGHWRSAVAIVLFAAAAALLLASSRDFFARR